MENNTIRRADNQHKIEHAPDLPVTARLPFELGRDACPLLDEYMEFSQKWSPRSYDGYYEGIFLWLLSTIAARRVAVIFGREKYTNLYIILVGRTTLYAKSTAVQIAKDLLYKISLDFLLLPDESTPQSLVVEMSGKVPENYGKLTTDEQEKIKLWLAFAGQRGWYYDEFGVNLQLMMRRDGPYVEFRSILRKFNDTEKQYKRSTIGRGLETVNRPYLALLGVLTPADLVPVARKGSVLWGDGNFARMAFIAPPQGIFRDGRFPPGEMIFPENLVNSLRAWHDGLGMPKVDISPAGIAKVVPGNISKLKLSDHVMEAFYNYDKALREIINIPGFPQDLDGNYGRLPDKALAIAGLFASLVNSPTIELNHWARAQEIVERWRRNLHDLYNQVTIENSKQNKLTDEDKIKRAIIQKGEPTAREIEQFTGLSSQNVDSILEQLIKTGLVTRHPAGKTARYSRTSLEPVSSTEKAADQLSDDGQFFDDFPPDINEDYPGECEPDPFVPDNL